LLHLRARTFAPVTIFIAGEDDPPQFEVASGPSKAMPEAEFRFIYKSEDGSSSLDAYDASQVLYGISRSLSILTHYAIHRKVIKQAPSLDGAKVLLEPPRRGSFEFIAPILLVSNIGALAQNFAASFLYDLAKTAYRRLSGKSETPSSKEMQALVRCASGDLDALSDAIQEDIVRIHRPLISTDKRYTISVWGGAVNIVNFDNNTYDFVKTKVTEENEGEFFGEVRSFNGGTIQGRFWVEFEERTIGFSKNGAKRISDSARQALSWSLDQWVNKREGYVVMKGYPLSSKTGLLKHVFLTGAKRA
jgi:hypothetical protein